MTTKLYLIRHGLAADRENFAVDEQRPLTAKGQSKTQQVARRLHTLQVHFDLLLTSPLVRARQTAEILKSEGLSSKLEEFSALAPLGKFEYWLTWLDSWQRGTSLALVGHQPDLSQWAERLIWGEARQVLELKKAGIIGITLPRRGSPVGNSHLFWLTAPRLLL